MKVVKMYNETPDTLTAYNIPFDGISKEVFPGESTATGTISSEDKEMAHKKTPSKRSPKSKAKDGDNDD